MSMRISPHPPFPRSSRVSPAHVKRSLRPGTSEAAPRTGTHQLPGGYRGASRLPEGAALPLSHRGMSAHHVVPPRKCSHYPGRRRRVCLACTTPNWLTNFSVSSQHPVRPGDLGGCELYGVKCTEWKRGRSKTGPPYTDKIRRRCQVLVCWLAIGGTTYPFSLKSLELSSSDFTFPSSLSPCTHTFQHT